MACLQKRRTSQTAADSSRRIWGYDWHEPEAKLPDCGGRRDCDDIAFLKAVCIGFARALLLRMASLSGLSTPSFSKCPIQNNPEKVATQILALVCGLFTIFEIRRCYRRAGISIRHFTVFRYIYEINFRHAFWTFYFAAAAA
jgi:hypothetical protein